MYSDNSDEGSVVKMNQKRECIQLRTQGPVEDTGVSSCLYRM